MAKVERTPGPGDSRLRVALKGIEGNVGKVGWFATAHYPSGVPVAYVAAVQEFGYPAKNIPPRLGMRATAKEKRPEWASVAEQGAKAVLSGNATAPQLMELIGLKAAGDIRKHITTVQEPPLKPATIARRLAQRSNKKLVGNLTKPLVFTGHLLTTLTNTTEKKK